MAPKAISPWPSAPMSSWRVDQVEVFARPAPAHAHSQRVATIFPNWRLVSK